MVQSNLNLTIRRTSMVDMVKSPPHYHQEGRAECIVEIRSALGLLGYVYHCLGTVHKYLYRAGNKENNPRTQDLAKARRYLEYASDGIIDMGAHWDSIADIKSVAQLYNNYQKELAKYD